MSDDLHYRDRVRIVGDTFYEGLTGTVMAREVDFIVGDFHAPSVSFVSYVVKLDLDGKNVKISRGKVIKV